MQARWRRLPAAALAAVALGGAAALSAGGGVAATAPAEGSPSRGGLVVAPTHAPRLELYALESSLERARADLAVLRARSSALALERDRVRVRLGLAGQRLGVARQRLAERLTLLYQHGDADPLAIVLGADSLDDAIAQLDGLELIAAQDAQAIEELRAAKGRLVRLTRALAARSAALERLETLAATKRASLSRGHAERTRYLARVGAARQLTASQIRSLGLRAHEATERARRLRPPRRPRTPVARGRTLTVVATGYSLGGRTATGIPVGPGIVAVDPSVIPLGTRITIPGYGEGVAADVGGAVRGARIDVWFSSTARAHAWGERTVTIRLH